MEPTTSFDQELQPTLRTNSALKQAALDNLRGRWSSAVRFIIVYMACTFLWLGVSWLCRYLLLAQIISLTLYSIIVYAGNLLLMPVLIFGNVNSFVIAEREDDALRVENLFMGFKNNDDYFKVVLLYFVVGIFITLWTILFIVPGIIKTFSYAMNKYIRRDYPELSAVEVVDLSKDMMYGHKWDLFLLNLSFIGWFILGILSCFIGFIWISPYYNATMAQFYEDVKKEYEYKQQPQIQ